MYKIPAKTLFLGKNLIFVPECYSTNDLALQLLQTPNWIDGTVIITHNQTAGRGQRGNSWFTEPGKNLTFSMLLKPALPVRDQFLLTLFVSLGIRDYLTARTQEKVQIKWPNDIVSNDKKLGGILIENQLSGMSVSSSVVGIGLNINQSRFPVQTASSLAIVAGKTFDLGEELELLLQHLEKRYLQMRDNKHQLMKSDYLTSLYRINERHQYLSPDDQLFEGIIVGVDDFGKLRVDLGNEVRIFDNKEIRYRMS